MDMQNVHGQMRSGKGLTLRASSKRARIMDSVSATLHIRMSLNGNNRTISDQDILRKISS